MWRLHKAFAGSGSLGDIGSHVMDMARYFGWNVAQICDAVYESNDTHGWVEVRQHSTTPCVPRHTITPEGGDI